MKKIYLITIVILSLVILRINIRLYSENYTRKEQKKDVILQLNFLESELKNNNLGARMQRIFPEGYVFVNALYGLAWCELYLSDVEDSVLKSKALNEALYAYNNLDSEQAKWSFQTNLNPENGIFYDGWKNYLLSRILTIDTTFKGSEQYTNKFQNKSNIISEALQNADCPYLESYTKQSWPADMFVAMASLSNHDKIFEKKYQSQINDWLHKIKERLDEKTNMIPHKVDSENGKAVEGARGCSIGLCLRMLAEINPDFAYQQYHLFDSLFVDKTFGLPSIREYPKGTHGLGDIDSGPVIFGVGFSATIVMIGTFATYKNHELAEQQYKTINAFGFSKKTKNQKKYLFGKLPMADAFIAWGRATDLNYSKDVEQDSNNFWRIQFHIISLLVLLILWMFYFRKRIIRRFTIATNKVKK